MFKSSNSTPGTASLTKMLGNPREGKTSGLLPMTKESTPLDGSDRNTSTKKKRFKGMATRTNITIAAFFFFLVVKYIGILTLLVP